MSLDESWQRYPEARLRMREQDLEILIKSLSGGIFIGGNPRLQLLDDGILISFTTNAGTSGKLIALPIDIFIPCEIPHEQEIEKEPTIGPEDLKVLDDLADNPQTVGDETELGIF